LTSSLRIHGDRASCGGQLPKSNRAVCVFDPAAIVPVRTGLSYRSGAGLRTEDWCVGDAGGSAGAGAAKMTDSWGTGKTARNVQALSHERLHGSCQWRGAEGYRSAVHGRRRSPRTEPGVQHRAPYGDALSRAQGSGARSGCGEQTPARVAAMRPVWNCPPNLSLWPRMAKTDTRDRTPWGGRPRNARPGSGPPGHKITDGNERRLRASSGQSTAEAAGRTKGTVGPRVVQFRPHTRDSSVSGARDAKGRLRAVARDRERANCLVGNRRLWEFVRGSILRSGLPADWRLDLQKRGKPAPQRARPPDRVLILASEAWSFTAISFVGKAPRVDTATKCKASDVRGEFYAKTRHR